MARCGWTRASQVWARATSARNVHCRRRPHGLAALVNAADHQRPIAVSASTSGFGKACRSHHHVETAALSQFQTITGSRHQARPALADPRSGRRCYRSAPFSGSCRVPSKLSKGSVLKVLRVPSVVRDLRCPMPWRQGESGKPLWPGLQCRSSLTSTSRTPAAPSEPAEPQRYHAAQTNLSA